jgi:hypothetical protein
MSRQVHKFSILDVIEDISSELRTDPSEEIEYVVVSWPVRAIIETLPQFIQKSNKDGIREKTPLGVLLGKIGDRTFYLNTSENFTGFAVHNSRACVVCDVPAEVKD